VVGSSSRRFEKYNFTVPLFCLYLFGRISATPIRKWQLVSWPHAVHNACFFDQECPEIYMDLTEGRFFSGNLKSASNLPSKLYLPLLFPFRIPTTPVLATPV